MKSPIYLEDFLVLKPNKRSHYSEKIDQLIGAFVEITFKDGDVKRGILVENKIGTMPYKLITSESDVCFYKNHVKRIIEEVR